MGRSLAYFRRRRLSVRSETVSSQRECGYRAKGARKGCGLAGIADLKGMNVAVTGASGFIGMRLVAALVAAGAQVTALVRSRHGVASVQALGARVLVAPLTTGPGLRDALAGQAVLFHFAYDMRAGGEVNLAAFAAVMDAAKRVGRIVHASSVVVYDDWPNGPLSESHPITTASGGGYRQAKMAMEGRLIAQNIPAAILQPTIVWGRGAMLWSEAAFAALRGGGVVLPDPVGLCPALHVDDLVQAALLAAVLPDLGQERFLIDGPERVTWAEFYQAHADCIGQGQVILYPKIELEARLGPLSPQSQGPSTAAKVSAGLRRLVGNRRFEAAVAKVKGLRGGSGPTYPDRSHFALYSARPEVATDLARARLGYAPTVTLAAGLAAIAAQL